MEVGRRGGHQQARLNSGRRSVACRRSLGCTSRRGRGHDIDDLAAPRIRAHHCAPPANLGGREIGFLQVGQVIEVATGHPNAPQAEASDLNDGWLPCERRRFLARAAEGTMVRVGSSNPFGRDRARIITSSHRGVLQSNAGKPARLEKRWNWLSRPTLNRGETRERRKRAVATRLNGETLHWLDALYNEGTSEGTSDASLLERFLKGTGAAREAPFRMAGQETRLPGPVALPPRTSATTMTPPTPFRRRSSSWPAAHRTSATVTISRPWLARVARRIARWHQVPKEAARRAARERRIAADVAESIPGSSDSDRLEIAALVQAEVDRLPPPTSICCAWTYWQGKTYEEAAALLSWPIGTVRSRLARIRDRLRGRLIRRGLAPTVAVASSAAAGSRGTGGTTA